MRITALLIGLIINSVTYGQKVVHTSNHILTINGSWDLSKDPKRAQFVSGNKNIQTLFIKNYKLTMERINRVKSGIVELQFIVKSDGKLDSIEFIKHDDNINDLEAIRLLSLTDGAWRPGQVDGKKLSEKLVIRYFFSDNAKEKSADKKILKAREAFDKASFDNCVKYCNQALEVNPFDTDVLKLKGISLLKLGKRNESCEVLNLASNYYAENIEELVSSSCN
jgi:hypothetical protein